MRHGPATRGTIRSEHLDLADTMLRRAKRSRGLIDAHLRESYGPDVDSLYYYLVNVKRLAISARRTRTTRTVRDIQRRVQRAVAESTDDAGNPIIDRPGPFVRALAPALAKIASKATF